MDLAGRVCNLECLEKEPQAFEFVGPVKIVLVNPPKKVYRRKICGAALLTLANMMIFATVMVVLYYSLNLTKKNVLIKLHIFLCTVGFQLCMPTGILLLNSLNGAAGPLKPEDRKCQHLFVQFFGIICALTGSAVAILDSGLSKSTFTVHCVTGLSSDAFSVIALASGPIAYFINKDVTKLIHLFFGVLAFILSSVCFILGLMEPEFQSWVPVIEMKYFSIMFCILYTLIIVIPPLAKLVCCLDVL